MPQTKKTARQKVSIVTIKRRQQIKEEIYMILQKEIFDLMNRQQEKEDSLIKRLNSIERVGVPPNTLEDIKMMVSQVRYTINKQTKVLEEMLRFFNVSKQLLEDKAE